MHIVFKLIALSVVFGLAVAEPVPQSSRSFDGLTYEAPYEVFDTNHDDSSAFELVESKTGPVAAILGIVSKIIGLKAKAFALTIGAIKWLAPKAIFLVIGAIGTLAFCFLTSKCSLAYDPVVYSYIPAQVRSFVTPERLEDAQQFLFNAMQQYADNKSIHIRRF